MSRFTCIVFALAIVAIAEPTAAPLMLIEYQSSGSSGLAVAGPVSSPAHEQILRDTAARAYPGRPASFTLSVGTGLPPEWSLLTDHALRALATTYSASAEIYRDSIVIRGVTADPAAWHEARTRLQSVLAPGMTLQASVATIAPGDTLDGMCQRLFARATGEREMSFGQSNAELSPGMRPLLDRLAELSMDCRNARITVSGNGDGGPQSADLGRRRAQAVVDYLKQQGITSDRLRVRGNAAPADGRVRFSVELRSR